jgi:uncharacterized LabA/DUF88 family protein
MALNIFPRREAQKSEPATKEPEPPPAMATASEDDNPPASTSRRSSTRTRRTTARSRSTDTETKKADKGESEDKPKTSSRRSTGDDADAEEKPRSTRSRSTRSRARKTETETETKPDAQAKAKVDSPPPAVDLEPLLKAIEQQGKQIEALSRALQEGQRGSAQGSYAPAARVGVFVDVANIELATDRARLRLDWGKVLNLLARNRQLVRATAYAPVHDDPKVSRETQRFVEPFLDKGYRIVTKPLKRFADGTIKANVDIELALDVMHMLDRLDVVCLVSGDGDFEPLVRAAQDRGVRVEVVAMANSCSNLLRETSDAFIDLQSRANEVRA